MESLFSTLELWILTNNVLIANALGILVIFLCTIAPHFKRKSGFVLCFFLANIVQIPMFYLLGAITAVATASVAAIRTLVLLWFADRKRVAPFWVFSFLIVIQIGAVIFVYQNIYSLLLLCTSINIYGQWQKDVRITRICAMITSFFFGVYSFIVCAYTGVLNEVIIICSASLALWRFRGQDIEKI